jgi:hypothetical protein
VGQSETDSPRIFPDRELIEHFNGPSTDRPLRQVATRDTVIASIWTICMGQSRFLFLFLLTWFALGCGSTPPQSTPPGSEVLYVVTSSGVTTYSIDVNSLSAVAVEQPVSLVAGAESILQFDPSPDDHFVYTVWSDGQTLQHLSVFSTDSSGVPQTPAVQVLNAAALSQFNMHPSGRFAYMLEVTNSAGLYQADIRLFHAQPNQGTLSEDPRVQGTYGPSPYWPAFLYGFSTDGSQLYDTSPTTTGSIYRERPIHLKTGILGSDSELLSTGNHTDIAIGRQVIVEQYLSDSSINGNYINVFWNTPRTGRAVIHCTAVMLSFCATATNAQLDTSGPYLFLTDPATRHVHVASIDLPKKTITDTGNSIPMTAQTPGFVLSPDGKILYAQLAVDNSVHFYHFDRASGSLTEGGTPLMLPPGAGICPAQRR